MYIRILTFIIISLFLNINLSAQDYKHSSSIRIGYSTGMSFQHFMDEERAIEVLMTMRSNGIQLHVFGETYKPLFLEMSDHLFFYYGLGAHFGYTRWTKKRINDNQYPYSICYCKRSAPVLGLDGMLGMEFRFYKFPIAFNMEFKPYSELFGRHFFDVNYYDFGIKFKYTF